MLPPFPGYPDAQTARRPPGTMGTGEPSRSLAGRPVSFQWARGGPSLIALCLFLASPTCG